MYKSRRNRYDSAFWAPVGGTFGARRAVDYPHVPMPRYPNAYIQLRGG